MLKNKANTRHEREWLVVFSLFHGSKMRERDWGESKVSQTRNKTTPPPAGKRQWVAKKKPPTLAGKDGAGSRSARACAKSKKQHTTAKQNVISSAKEASASPPRGLKNTHTPEKKVLGFSQARRRPLPAQNEGWKTHPQWNPKNQRWPRVRGLGL